MNTARYFVAGVAIIAAALMLGPQLPVMAQKETPQKAPEQPVDEDEEIPLLQEAIQLLEEANLDSILEDRRLLQDLENKIPDADTIITEAQKRLLELQASGAIPSEEIKAAANAVLDHPSQDPKAAVSATDVLSPEPKKAPRALDPAAEEKTIKIKTFGSVHFDSEKRVMVFEEDVVVTDAEFEIKCDLLDVYLDEQMQVQRAIASGKMVVINGENSEGNPIQARCRQAIYEGNRITLREWPEISSGGRTMKATAAATVIGFDIGEDDKLDPWVKGPVDGALKKPDQEKKS